MQHIFVERHVPFHRMGAQRVHHHNIVHVGAGAGDADVELFELVGRGVEGDSSNPGHGALLMGSGHSGREH